MSEIVIFGGATEGRELAEYCAENRINADVCVTTSFGAALLPNSPYIRKIVGRMDEFQMSELFRKNKYRYIIDATHIYAVEATKNIRSASTESGGYIRLVRDNVVPSGTLADSIDDIVNLLNQNNKTILSTLGSKELPALTKVKNFRDRIWYRVLPTGNIADFCENLGYDKNKIIAEKGKFTEERNIYHINISGAEILLTKQTGVYGGYPEKISACQKSGIEVITLTRPSEIGYGMEQVKNLIDNCKNKIYIVGAGMNGTKTLTCQALEIIENAHILIGSERILKPFTYLKKTVITEYITEKILDYINNNTDKTIAVLMSGDCGFYSGAEKLAGLLGGRCEIICGISTPVYMCSKIGRKWENMKFISLHGRENNIAVNVMQNELCFFLMGGTVSPAQLCERLNKYGLTDITVFIGENLGYTNEKITSGKPEGLIDYKSENLCAVITENKSYLKYIPSGISDGEFIQSDIPMTKAEIRSLVISWLNIGKNSVCWDIGCGTGSVSVEMALRCPDGKVYSFDRKSQAVELTLENAVKFSCDNIQTSCVIFPDDTPENVPAPDCVFIGGTSGKLRETIDFVRKKNRSARIVLTAVSLETVSQCLEFPEAEIVQISATRTRKIGNHTMMSAENPVFIVRLKPCGE
ncbi:MAG: precorrin-6y C5,15-methyltransferase (decarboxylating) subunit CbiE [Ruminococcus sp.]|nr:precorrin-6y C5,15-methyltransferase (decarboxylating) subunit CbiE [Ruminococcus sp.]